MDSDQQLKLMAAAIFEIRVLLAKHLGSESDSNDCDRMAAHLAYALHNDALAILEGGGVFDVGAAQARIISAEAVVGSEYGDGFKVLKGDPEA